MMEYQDRGKMHLFHLNKGKFDKSTQHVNSFLCSIIPCCTLHFDVIVYFKLTVPSFILPSVLNAYWCEAFLAMPFNRTMPVK